MKRQKARIKPKAQGAAAIPLASRSNGKTIPDAESLVQGYQNQVDTASVTQTLTYCPLVKLPTLMPLKPQDEIASSFTALALASSPGRQSCVTRRGQHGPPMGLQMVNSCSLGSPESLESSSHHCSWPTARLFPALSSCPVKAAPALLPLCPPLPPSMPLALVGGSWLNRTRCSLPHMGLQVFLPQAESCFSREMWKSCWTGKAASNPLRISHCNSGDRFVFFSCVHR